MREYGIRFSKGLRKGLRQFPTSEPGEEMLIECFNLQPGETGLLPRDNVVLFDVFELRYTYSCLRAEDETVWCVWIDVAGQININPGSPIETIDGYEPAAITPAIIPYYWETVAINDPDLTLFIYPDVTGSLIVDFNAPANEPGFNIGNSLIFTSPNGYRYELFVTNTLESTVKQLE